MSKLSNIIDLLAATSSTKEKQAILERNKNNDDLRLLFYATLDPMINYYIRGEKLEADPFHQVDGELRELSAADIKTVITVLDSRSKTGHAARDWIQGLMSELVPEDRELLKKMLNRDLDCKVAGGLVNRVWKGLLFEYPCLLADKLTPERIEQLIKEDHSEFIVQLKADGGRCNMIVRDGRVRFFSRNGNELTMHGVFDEIAKHFDGFMVDGELLVIKGGDVKNRQTGNGIFNKAVRGTISQAEAESFHFVVWDMVPVAAFDAHLDTTPYKIRLNNLADVLRKIGHNTKISLIDSKFVSSIEDVQEYYRERIANGEEGAILKLPYLKWENDRSADMLKLKEQRTCDLLCVGTEPHSKDPELIGSLLLETSDGLIQVSSGSGLKDEDREKDPSEFVGKVIEIEYNAVIKAKDKETYALFLPIFKGIRLDKTEADSFSDVK